MGGKEINFGDTKISKKDFYKSKKLFKIEDIDINKILGSKMESYGKKGLQQYLIGYNDDDFIRPLCIKPPQTIGYVKYFDGCKKVSFVVNKKKLLKKYSKIWEKIRGFIGKKFNSKPVWGGKYIGAKICKDRVY